MPKKNQILFYLNRYQKDLDALANFDQEAAAKKGMTYSERHVKATVAEQLKPEADAMNAVINFLVNNMREEEEYV